MRWLIVVPFEQPDHLGMDFRDELRQMGHEVATFAYRRDNPLYKNRGTKAPYQRLDPAEPRAASAAGGGPTSSSS